MQSSLDRLSNIDGYVSGWQHADKAVEFKNRIRQTLACRHLGVQCEEFSKALSFEDMFFSINASYNHIDVFQFTEDDWEKLFSNLEPVQCRILQFVFEHLLEMYETTDLDVQEMFEEDADGLVEAYGLEDVDYSEVIDIWNALEKANNGEILTDIPEAVEGFLDTITDMFSDVNLTNNTVLNHLSTFTRFLSANENYQIITRAYSSEEVYLYNTYKDNLPADIRKEADMYVNIFRDPFTEHAFEDWNFDFFCDDVHETGSTLVVFSTTRKGYSNDAFADAVDCKLFLQDAVKYCKQELPKLRLKYGSRVESTPTFFIAKI